MVSLKNKSKGFTIVELLIVIVVIAILATLVIVTFTGIQQKARDSQRQTDINALNSHLAAYYASNGVYPTLANLQDMTATTGWVAVNMKGLDPESLRDPKAAANATIAGTAAANAYGYAVTPSGCDNSATSCTGFTLTANLEGGGTFTKASNT